MVIVCVIIGVIVVIGGLALLGMGPRHDDSRPAMPMPRPQPSAERPLVPKAIAPQPAAQPVARATTQPAAAPAPVEDEFACRATLRTEQSKGGSIHTFCIEIRGTVTAPSDNYATRCRINIDDITEGSAQPIKCTVAKYQTTGGIFLYEEANGKLPRARTVIGDWMTVATLPAAMLNFARKGPRKLLFRVALVSCETGESVAAAKTSIVFENTNLGYLDADLNIARTQQHGVTLALAMALADDKVADSELDVIRNWAASKLSESNGGDFVPDAQLERQLEKALTQALKFFSSGGRIDIRALCSEIVSLVPEAERLELLRLCISVARADGEVCEKEVDVLNRFSIWLVLDRTKVRQMVEQLLPADLSTFRNPDVTLGITNDMEPELIRKYLNDEYRRWNSRVTNNDPVVRQRAEKVMSMIAEARRKYVREQSPAALHTLTPRPGNN
jgi:uncharacterized tellurite resistance protein B-like protein